MSNSFPLEEESSGTRRWYVMRTSEVLVSVTSWEDKNPREGGGNMGKQIEEYFLVDVDNHRNPHHMRWFQT